MAPPTPVAPTDPLAAQARQVEQACREPIARLIEELDLCRRYYEATFQNRPVDRLIFVGGESRHKWLCQQVARELGLAAQLGDPLVRMSKVSDVGIESGIDRRQPQPAWAVAIGLSLGPTAGPSPSPSVGARARERVLAPPAPPTRTRASFREVANEISQRTELPARRLP
jgi:hypothetical protein